MEKELIDGGIGLPLWSTPKNFRQTRKGKILQTVQENYLRDDLGWGFTVPFQTNEDTNVVNTSGAPQKIDSVQDLLNLFVCSNDKSLENKGIDRSNEKKLRLCIVDTNILLHNLDVLEHPSHAISNIVVTQTALLECRHRSFSAYRRVLELLRNNYSSVSNTDSDTKSSNSRKTIIFFPDRHHVSTQVRNPATHKYDSANDENDARIRQVAFYYGQALAGTGVEVVLLTEDSGCRDLALKQQRAEIRNDDDKYDGFVKNEEKDQDNKCENDLWYIPKSVKRHVMDLEKEDPNLTLSDVIAQFSCAHLQSEKRNFYNSHLSQNELSVGVKSGKYFQGTIRAEFGRFDKCYVNVRKGEDRIAIVVEGEQDVNRSVDGDVVVVELHPLDCWIDADSTNNLSQQNLKNKNSNQFGKKTEILKKEIRNKVAIAAETADPDIKDEENIAATVEVLDQGSSSTSVRRPTGKIVGILRRNFRQNYCGTIFSATSKKDEPSIVQDGGDKNVQDNKYIMIANQFEEEHADGSITCVFFAVDGRVPPILVRTTQQDRLIGYVFLILKCFCLTVFLFQNIPSMSRPASF